MSSTIVYNLCKISKLLQTCVSHVTEICHYNMSIRVIFLCTQNWRRSNCDQDLHHCAYGFWCYNLHFLKFLFSFFYYSREKEGNHFWHNFIGVLYKTKRRHHHWGQGLKRKSQRYFMWFTKSMYDTICSTSMSSRTYVHILPAICVWWKM